MKSERAIQMLGLFVAAGMLSGCAEQTRSGMNIDPRADDALRKMSVAIGGAKAFSFRSVATMEEPVATGQMAEFSRDLRIVVDRPDRIMAEGRQGDDAVLLWYEGTSLTMFDKPADKYATLQVPGRIDEMLDDVAQKHGLTLPLADLLFADPYKILTERLLTGRYVGRQTVDGVMCDHLLITQEAIDWQIWIDAAKEPVPRRLVIDYRSTPGRPQFTAELSDWNLSAAVADDQFKPVIPSTAKKVEVEELLQAGQGE